ncbi:hypothetical protein B0H19DRAFT_231855 [Mycena capillaripes]|nr:hypothetical protein B0H19DRAFT_231855 [Mycena capillaripes]
MQLPIAFGLFLVRSRGSIRASGPVPSPIRNLGVFTSNTTDHEDLCFFLSNRRQSPSNKSFPSPSTTPLTTRPSRKTFSQSSTTPHPDPGADPLHRGRFHPAVTRLDRADTRCSTRRVGAHCRAAYCAGGALPAACYFLVSPLHQSRRCSWPGAKPQFRLASAHRCGAQAHDALGTWRDSLPSATSPPAVSHLRDSANFRIGSLRNPCNSRTPQLRSLCIDTLAGIISILASPPRPPPPRPSAPAVRQKLCSTEACPHRLASPAGPKFPIIIKDTPRTP